MHQKSIYVYWFSVEQLLWPWAIDQGRRFCPRAGCTLDLRGRPASRSRLSSRSQKSFETVTMTRRYVADVIGTPFTIEFFLLGDDPHNQERFHRRAQVRLLDRLVWLPTVEDVIVTKLRWSLLGNRSKDKDDIRGVIAVQGDRID